MMCKNMNLMHMVLSYFGQCNKCDLDGKMEIELSDVRKKI